MSVWNEPLVRAHQPGHVAVYSGLMAELYDQSWYGTFVPEEVAFFVGRMQGRRTLEIACGTGRVTLPLLERGLELYGVEGAGPMFRALQARLPDEHSQRFVRWDARQTPFPAADGAFGGVIIPFSSFGLIHDGVQELDDNRLLRECHRLLRPGGLLIVNDYRTRAVDEGKLLGDLPLRVHHHLHPRHGPIREEQQNRFELRPSRVLPRQAIRHRHTALIREQDGRLLEQHHERIPLWDAEDFPLLGADAGLDYEGRELCQFHESESLQHIFVRR